MHFRGPESRKEGQRTKGCNDGGAKPEIQQRFQDVPREAEESGKIHCGEHSR